MGTLAEESRDHCRFRRSGALSGWRITVDGEEGGKGTEARPLQTPAWTFSHTQAQRRPLLNCSPLRGGGISNAQEGET